MTPVDLLLQRWRIGMVRPFVAPGARVLDIGCADGVFARQVPALAEYVGIDPDLTATQQTAGRSLLRGKFPGALPDERPFDAIVMLAVLEHIPAEAHAQLAADCARYLKPDGHLLITVPSPLVDRILAVLRFLRLIDGMNLEEHYGFDTASTVPTFVGQNLRLVCHRRFQLGLNNLFVFQKLAIAQVA